MIGLEVGEEMGVIKLSLIINFSVLLSDVSVNSHFAGFLIDRQIEDARTSLNEFRTKRGEAGFAAISKIDSSIGAPEVATVVTSC